MTEPEPNDTEPASRVTEPASRVTEPETSVTIPEYEGTEPDLPESNATQSVSWKTQVKEKLSEMKQDISEVKHQLSTMTKEELWEHMLHARVYEPKECCCCMGPKKAAVGVAVFNFIVHALHIGHMCYYMGSSYHEYIVLCFHRTRWINLDLCVHWMMYVVYGTTITSIITILATFVLCHGIKKTDPKYVLYYLIVKVCSMVYYGLIFGGFFLYIVIMYQDKYGWLYAFLIMGPLGFFWEVFFFLLVRVYYKKLLFPEHYVRKPNPDLEETRKYNIFDPPELEEDDDDDYE